jgi:hypothetical protein
MKGNVRLCTTVVRARNHRRVKTDLPPAFPVAHSVRVDDPRIATLRLRAPDGAVDVDVRWPPGAPVGVLSPALALFVPRADRQRSGHYLALLADGRGLVALTSDCGVDGRPPARVVEWLADHARELDVAPDRLMLLVSLFPPMTRRLLTTEPASS